MPHKFTQLPPEIVLDITEQLTFHDLTSLSLASRFHRDFNRAHLPARLFRTPNALQQALFHNITNSHLRPLEALLTYHSTNRFLPPLPTNLHPCHGFSRNHAPHPLCLAASLSSPHSLTLLLHHYPWPAHSCPLRVAARFSNLRTLHTLVTHLSAASTPPHPHWHGYEHAVRSAAKHCSAHHHALAFFLRLGLSADMKQVCIEAAAKAGSVHGVEMMLRAGARIRHTWVPRAARLGHWGVLRALVEAGAEVDSISGGSTALMEVLQLWISEGVAGWAGWAREAAEEEGGWVDGDCWRRGGQWREGRRPPRMRGLGEELTVVVRRLEDRRVRDFYGEGEEEVDMAQGSAMAESLAWFDGVVDMAVWLLKRGASGELAVDCAEGCDHANEELVRYAWEALVVEKGPFDGEVETVNDDAVIIDGVGVLWEMEENAEDWEEDVVVVGGPLLT